LALLKRNASVVQGAGVRGYDRVQEARKAQRSQIDGTNIRVLVTNRVLSITAQMWEKA
jgi:hypothetical protein